MRIIVEPNGIGKYIKNTNEIRKCNANLAMVKLNETYVP